MGRKVRSKLLCFLVAAVMAIAMLPQMSLVAKAETVVNYNLWICGRQVSSVDGAAWSMSGTNGGTASFDGSTLTLTNFNWAGKAYCYSDTGSNNDAHAAIYSLLDSLTINLVGNNSITVSSVTDSGNARWISGIAYANGPLTIHGNGKLTIQNTVVSQEYSYGLYAFGLPININGGTIDIATGDTRESRGIYCGDLNMTSGSLTATAGDGSTASNGIRCTTATISGGTIVATAGTGNALANQGWGSAGIYTENGMTISGNASVTATGGNGEYNSSGVEGSVTITGGSLTCSGGDTTNHGGGLYFVGSYGVRLTSGKTLTIGTNASFTASGIDKAVYSSTSETAIKNSITGTGWTDTAGTEGAEVIPISTIGQSFDYKKVRFPEAHLSNIKATAIGYTGTYDGQAHGITVNVTNPTSGATVKFGTTEGTYDLGAAPTYTNAGSYTVYYKITAAGYNSETGSAKVTINKATSYITTAPAAVSGLTATGQAQVLITSGTSSGGTMQYALGTSETSAPDSGWSTTLPGATDAGDYYVWYKVVGDEDHTDSEPYCVTVTIEEQKQNKDEAVANVIDLINKLPSPSEVTVTDKNQIEAARAAYDVLTDEQKSKIPEETLKKLTDAESALAKLQNDTGDTQQNADGTKTVTKENADGKTILVTNYNKSDEQISQFVFKKANGTKLDLKNVNSKSLKTVVVPATVKANGKTYKVTRIYKGFLKNCKQATKVDIGKNINTIDKNAFNYGKKVKKVVIRGKLNKVGKYAFKNTKKNVTIEVKTGAKNFEKNKKLLVKSGLPKKATVKRIKNKK